MPAANSFRYPRIDERLAILGCTGSGKTTLAAHVLSRAPFEQIPYICVDYKGDDLLAQIPRLKEIGAHEKIPSKPGLFVIRPLPSEKDAMEAWLWKVWEAGNTGLYIDEAYLLPNQKAIQNILSQGRSLHIPGIFASQRPVDVPRSIFTEASHIAAFRLNDDRDRATVREFTPDGMIPKKGGMRLPDFHCYWYNVNDHKSDDPVPWFICKPVPTADIIVERINARLSPDVRVT